jgi:NADPH-dependent 2,4-dienoyl-CoA reductase/sulfur reductase-like enzyme/peroxiredoxin family protein/TusA-related sulfurtransferase/rhodanese-related sulfurtransferase
MNTSNAPHIVIVGGVAAGASCAARARRLSEAARITIIERGPDISFANCGLPYFIGGEIKDRSRLALQTPQSLGNLLNVEVRIRTEAIAIDRAAKTLRLRNLEDGTESTLSYDKLVLTPGAAPLRPPMRGVDDPRILTLRNLQDMDRIAAAASTAQRALIIGAGFIGLEMAEQLVHLKKEVALVELADQVLPQMDPEMTALLRSELESNGVRLVLGDGIEGFDPEPDRIVARLKSGASLDADLVILSIGVKPESGLATAAGLQTGARGTIAVNPWMQTSDPDIYAAGDVVESFERVQNTPMNLPLGGPANRQGRVIADHIFLPDQARPYPGHIGTAIVRAFDAACGITGWSEKRLKQAGIPFETTTVTDMHHAGYYPGAVPLTVKILWDPATGRLLGGQAMGAAGVDKRLDVLATALAGKLTVDDLVHLELSYAPPFGSARDLINTAGFAAQNSRNALVNPVRALPEGELILDVRPAVMASADPIPGSINIPLGELRKRLGELDKSRPLTAVCALGKNSYFAARILNQNGFQARSVVGGWKLLKGSQTMPHLPSPAPVPEPAAPSREPIAQRLDATGLSCPGPLMRMSNTLRDMRAGELLEVKASDSGFARDVQAFCASGGHQLVSLEKDQGILIARVKKTGGTAMIPSQSCCGTAATPAPASRQGATIICFSGELDKALAAFVIANGAAAMGGPSAIFFTFWGLNVIRKNPAPSVEKDLMGNMFGMMMPQGADALPLSNMHMAGMGTAMMKYRMASKNLPNLPGLMAEARKQGVRLLACSMSMEAMGLKLEELVDGVEVGGVADMLACSSNTASTLFI